MSFLELKIPPVIVALATAGLSWLFSQTGPLLPFGDSTRTIIAIVALGASVGIAASAIIQFLKTRTTLNPHRPKHTASLITTGIYRYSRNPMYLGILLALLSWAIFLGSLLALTPLLLFVLYLTRFQIEPEERALSVIFGQEYTAYRRKVRRWL